MPMTEPMMILLAAAFGVLAIVIVVLLVRNASLRGSVAERAHAQFQAWRDEELAALQAQYRDMAQKEGERLLGEWKVRHEDGIRRDAVDRSRAVVAGKVTEHLLPYLPDFPFNPKDVRFIGSPVDLLVFDGLDEGDVRSVVFIEVKTGGASLSKRERQIRDAIMAGRVAWQQIRVTRTVSSTTEDDAEAG